jgi:hypothetical protein
VPGHLAIKIAPTTNDNPANSVKRNELRRPKKLNLTRDDVANNHRASAARGINPNHAGSFTNQGDYTVDGLEE